MSTIHCMTITVINYHEIHLCILYVEMYIVPLTHKLEYKTKFDFKFIWSIDLNPICTLRSFWLKKHETKPIMYKWCQIPDLSFINITMHKSLELYLKFFYEWVNNRRIFLLIIYLLSWYTLNSFCFKKQFFWK